MTRREKDDLEPAMHGDAGTEDRAELLREAAAYLDGRRHELGGAADEVSPEGELLRDLVSDVARFGDYPAVHELDAKTRASGLNAPEALQGLTGESRLFSVYFPLVLKPRRAWEFHRLDLGVRFNPDGGPPGSRPKVVEALPNSRFRTLLKASGSIDVQLSAEAHFEAALPDVPLSPAGIPGSIGGGVDAHTAAHAGLLFTPFTYELRRAEIKHSEIGAEDLFWELTGGEFKEGAVPAFVVLAQVAPETEQFTVTAAMRVARNFRLAGGGFVQAVLSLPAGLKAFIERGAPIDVSKTWDLAPRLERVARG